MDDIIINSYTRQFDEKTQISAMDMAYSISSLLESPSIALSSTENMNPNNKDKKKDTTAIEDIHDCLYDNFWVAYDALDLK